MQVQSHKEYLLPDIVARRAEQCNENGHSPTLDDHPCMV